MNKQLQEFARSTLKDNLSKCNEGQQMIFRRMYSHKDLERPIFDVVDSIKPEDLDWVMTQVQNTLDKK